MRTVTKAAWTLALAALAAASAPARAGEAIRLVLEPPKDTTTVEAGDPAIEVQIVGIDAAGNRVGPSGRTLKYEATYGEIVVVTPPYRYQYTPPAAIDQPTPLKLRAWIKEAPEIAGEVNLTLMPHRPYERLILVASATSVELGKSIDVEVRGVRADGSSVLAAREPIKLTSDGVGSLDSIEPSVYRYRAPARAETKYVGATARLHAYLERYPKVAGDLSIVITGEAPPSSPGGSPTPPVTPPKPYEPTNPPTVPPTQPPARPPRQPTTPPTAEPPADATPGVVWTNRVVKLIAWRTKSRDPKEDWNSVPRRRLPPAGKSFVAPQPLQHLRVQILRDDVKKVEIEWYADKRSAKVHVDDSDPSGALRLERKDGRRDAVLVLETPESAAMLVATLIMTTDKGDVLTEEFLLQRGHDRDNDGEKDKRK
jgi:hypothetical protein